MTSGTADDPARVVFFPVRHHSPACALALLRAFDEIKPRQVLVEAPADFEPLLPALTHPATRPPVAIVSLPLPGDGGDSHVATYPFCDHSPEFVALAWARGNAVRTTLIDLPARHARMRRREAEGETAPVPLIAEWRLDHNAYVAELCARRGVADGLALWDALFESQAGTADWRGFFDGVGLYCLHTREVTDRGAMEADGSLAREAHMAARLEAALAHGPWPVAVVTGGFHTPALRDGLARPAPKPFTEKAAPRMPTSSATGSGSSTGPAAMARACLIPPTTTDSGGCCGRGVVARTSSLLVSWPNSPITCAGRSRSWRSPRRP